MLLEYLHEDTKCSIWKPQKRKKKKKEVEILCVKMLWSKLIVLLLWGEKA